MKLQIQQRTSIEQAFFNELVEYMGRYPKNVDQKILKMGNDVIGFYRDENFSNNFLNFRELAVEMFSDCSTDLINGATLLKRYSVGIAFNGKDLFRFISRYGDPVHGTVLMRITLKEQGAFANWTKEVEQDIDQNFLNSAVYSLAYYVSSWA